MLSLLQGGLNSNCARNTFAITTFRKGAVVIHLIALTAALVGSASWADGPHFLLEGFDSAADANYVNLMGTIKRPDMGIIIPATIQPDGEILLGDPPVDKLPSLEVQRAVCGQAIYYEGLPERTLFCPPD